MITRRGFMRAILAAAAAPYIARAEALMKCRGVPILPPMLPDNFVGMAGPCGFVGKEDIVDYLISGGIDIGPASTDGFVGIYAVAEGVRSVLGWQAVTRKDTRVHLSASIADAFGGVLPRKWHIEVDDGRLMAAKPMSAVYARAIRYQVDDGQTAVEYGAPIGAPFRPSTMMDEKSS